MADPKPEATAAVPPVKSKKMLVIGLVVVVVLLVGAVAGFLLLKSSRAHADDDLDAEEVVKPVVKDLAKNPPTFLGMESMVVNLADPGGERFLQVSITLEVADSKTSDLIGKYMPSIRSGVLMLLSQRTSEELLTREGKEKLARDVLVEVSRPLGFSVPRARPASAAGDGDDDGEDRRQRRAAASNPVHKVHFSSFIIQ